LSAQDRVEIVGFFAEVTSAEVHLLGSADLADLLDLNPEVSRAFPQILSYRNLVAIVQRRKARRYWNGVPPPSLAQNRSSLCLFRQNAYN